MGGFTKKQGGFFKNHSVDSEQNNNTVLFFGFGRLCLFRLG